MKLFKSAFQILVLSFIFFLCAEGVARLAQVPSGASRFIEKVVIKNQLSIHKPKDERRVFTYGESTMYGSYYGPISSPANWLEAYLKDFLPAQKIKVVNFARLGCNSYFVLNSVKETLAYQPDLMIFYLGHNSFLPGNRKQEVYEKYSGRTRVIWKVGQKSRFFAQVYRAYLKVVDELTKSKKDSLEHAIGFVEKFPQKFEDRDVIGRDEPEYWENIEFTKENIASILKIAKENKIPVIFFKPVCNLKGFSPSHSEHLMQLTFKELSSWNNYYRAGVTYETESLFDKALSNYHKAYSIDPTYAHLSFRMGRLYFKQKNYLSAKKSFEEARDHDTVINRATIDILNLFEELRKEFDFIYIDTEKVLQDQVEGGILGEPVIEDNVHFSIEGHFLIGRSLAMEIADRNLLFPRNYWYLDHEKSYLEICQELGIDKNLLISAYLKNIEYFGNRLENRVKYAKKVLELEPNNVFALRHLAWAYWLGGNYREAFQVYHKIEAQNPLSLEEIFKLRPRLKKFYKNVRIPTDNAFEIVH